MTTPAPKSDTPPDSLLEWLRGKVAIAKTAVKIREEMVETWRTGTDAEWKSAADIHPSTAARVQKKEDRIKEADMHERIAEKLRHELAMFKAVERELAAAKESFQERDTRVIEESDRADSAEKRLAVLHAYDGDSSEAAAVLWEQLAPFEGEDADAQRIIEHAFTSLRQQLAAAQQRADEAVRAEQDVRQILDTYVGVEARAEKAEADYTRVAREFNDLSAKSTFELANLKARVATLASLLEQMLNVAENADETGYVTDCGFIDLDKLHAEVRSALAPATKETK